MSIKYYHIIGLLATVALVSCTAVEKEEEPEVVNQGQDGYTVLTIQASRFDDTKTAYANEVTFSWSAGDQISVLCNNGTDNFWQTFTVDTPSSASSTFTAQAPVGTKIGSLDENPVKIALYPADANHVYTGATEISFHIPAVRDFRSTNGGHKETAIPMFAWGDNNDCFAFANLTGAAKFTFVNIPSNTTQVKFLFENTCHLKLNGTYLLTTATNAADVAWSAASTDVAAESAVTYYADVENGMATFYLPYAEGALWPWNHVKLVDANNESTVFYNNSKVNKIVITKNQIVKLPSLDASTGGVVNDFTSKWNINWNTIAAAINTNDTYPAIRKMKATSDDSYLYLYMEVDPSKLVKTHNYDHKFRLFVADENSSTEKYWASGGVNEKVTEIESSDAWAVKNGNCVFEYYNSQNPPYVDHHEVAETDTWYYEVKIARTHAKTNAYLGYAGTVKIGVILDDYYYNEHHYRLNNEVPYGVIPKAGSEMYSITLSGNPAPSPNPVNVSLSFDEATGEVANPERGMMSYSKFVFENNTIPTVSNIPVNYTGESLAFLLFYMTDYMNKDLDQNALSFISAEFDKVRERNMKAVARFAYTETHTANTQHEATPTQVLRHIDQVRDILVNNADILYLVQCGWLGTYGEWYYKTNNNGESVSGYNDYYKYTVNGSSVTDFNNNHKNLLDRLLSATYGVPAPIQIGLRTATYKRYYLSPSDITSWESITSWGSSSNHRLALYNDGFRGSDSDVGTFHSDVDWNMWYSQGNWLACGGEMSYRSESAWNEVSDNLKNCNLSIAEMYRQHWSYLHYSESNRFMAKWIGEGRMEDLKQALGYRIYLTSASLSGDLNSGSTLDVSLTLNNSGTAPVIYPRPMQLVLLRGNSVIVLNDNCGDIRSVPAGTATATTSNVTISPSTFTFSFTVTLPQDIVAGDQLAIWLPDRTAGLQSNAAYSIHLVNPSNQVTWTSGGYNVFYTF